MPGSRVLPSQVRTGSAAANFYRLIADYLLESAGPGSTFLMSPRLFELVRQTLAECEEASSADYRDWLIYVIARAHGWKWHIDGEATVDYRQHGDNVMGSNRGLRAAMRRLGLIRRRWHRRQAALLSRVGICVAPDGGIRASLEQLHHLFTARGTRARLGLLRLSWQLRRRPRDRGIIGVLVATGLW